MMPSLAKISKHSSNMARVEAAQGFSTASVVWIVLATIVATVAVVIGAAPYLVVALHAESLFYQPDYSLPWVQSLEQQLVVQQITQQQRYPTVAEMKMLWQTPMLHVNIAALVGPVDVPKFNARLAAAVLHEFERLQTQNPTKVRKDGVTSNDANQIFFEWQKKGGWQALRAAKEIRLLEEFIQTGVDKYLKTLGLDPKIIESRSRELEIWSTVHDRCVKHLAHCHPNSLVSGVYYVKMPDDAGSIIFDDPRGPLPPFDNKLTIRPLAGDLVIFPSWLIHQVSPTPGDEERISIAFNIPGHWETTVGVSEFFNLPEN